MYVYLQIVTSIIQITADLFCAKYILCMQTLLFFRESESERERERERERKRERGREIDR